MCTAPAHAYRACPCAQVSALSQKLSEAGLPKEAETVAERELRRLRQMAPQQAEYAVTTGYLEWLGEM